MERLLDESDPMDIERAKAVADVGQRIINSAKVEVEFVKHTGHGGTAFLQGSAAPPAKQLAAVPPIDITPETKHEDLCQHCTLPDCDESSEKCLVKIQRKMAA